MTTSGSTKGKRTATRTALTPGVGDNPFSELIAMMLFTGPVDGCTCQLCELCRKAKAEMAARFVKRGKV